VPEEQLEDVDMKWTLLFANKLENYSKDIKGKVKLMFENLVCFSHPSIKQTNKLRL
jgi:hypothetical protein